MNSIIGLIILLVIVAAMSKTPRAYLLLWAFATPIFYIIFGFKATYISLGFTDVELFSGVLPIIVSIMSFRRLTKTERSRAWKYSPKIWFLFLAFYAASLFWSDNPATGIRTVIQLIFPSVMFMIAFNLIQGDMHVKKYYKMMFITNIIVAVIDIYGVTTYWNIVTLQGSMIEGAIGYRTVSAYFYGTMGILLLMQVLDEFKLVPFLMFLLNIGLLILAGSRTPTYAFLAGVVVTIIMRRSLVFSLLGILTGGVVILFMLVLPSKNRFITDSNSVNTMDSGRAFFQKYFTDRAEEGPLWGFGAGSSEKYAQWISEHVTPVGAPHNEYIRVRFDTGKIGLYLFYIGLGGLLIWGLSMGRSISGYFSMKAVLALTPIMFAVSCTNDNTFFYYYVFTQYLFTFMGFAARIAYEERLIAGTEHEVLSIDEHEQVLEETYGLAT